MGRVLIVSEHSSRGYSGGRYHSWMMAEAIAAGGEDVTVWSNAVPLLMRDFVDFPAHGRIALHVDSSFCRAPDGEFDLVFLVPGMRLGWGVFGAAIAASRRHRAPLVLLDFESPAWFNSENVKKRSWLRRLPLWWSARFAEIVLSTTAFGSAKAQEYYRPPGGLIAFRHCYCGINSFAADRAEAEQERQIICITRMDRNTAHKGASDLLSLMCEELRGYRVLVVGSVPEGVQKMLRDAAAAHGMTFANRTGLTDAEKFQAIKSSRLMVFLSHFEGFGYPPVEALYCGIPCIARPLKVLREVSGNYLHYLDDGASLPQLAVQILAATDGRIPDAARARAADVAKFESYVGRLQDLLSEIRHNGVPHTRNTGAIASAIVMRLEGQVIAFVRGMVNAGRKP